VQVLALLAQVTRQWAPTPRYNFLLLFKKETRQRSEYLKPLIGLLALFISKLWEKINN